MWLNRSWTCVFFGHKWAPVFHKKTVAGFGDTYIVSHYMCVRCDASKVI